MIYTPVNIAGWKMDLLKYIVPIIKAMLVDQRVPSRSLTTPTIPEFNGWFFQVIRRPFRAERYVFRSKIAVFHFRWVSYFADLQPQLMVSWWLGFRLDPFVKGIRIVIFLGVPRFERQTTGVPLTIGWQAPHVELPPSFTAGVPRSKLHPRCNAGPCAPNLTQLAPCTRTTSTTYRGRRSFLVEFGGVWGKDIWKLNMKTHETLQKVSGKKELLFRTWQFKFESSQLMFSPCLFFLLPRSSVAPSLIFLQFAGVMAVFFIYSKPLFTPEAKTPTHFGQFHWLTGPTKIWMHRFKNTPVYRSPKPKLHIDVIFYPLWWNQCACRQWRDLDLLWHSGSNGDWMSANCFWRSPIFWSILMMTVLMMLMMVMFIFSIIHTLMMYLSSFDWKMTCNCCFILSCQWMWVLEAASSANATKSIVLQKLVTMGPPHFPIHMTVVSHQILEVKFFPFDVFDAFWYFF